MPPPPPFFCTKSSQRSLLSAQTHRRLNLRLTFADAFSVVECLTAQRGLRRTSRLFITSHAKLKKDDNVCHSRPYPERNSLTTKRLDVNFSKEPPDRAVRPGATQNRQSRKPSVSANCLMRYLQHMEQFHSISHMVGQRCDVMFECSQNSPRIWPHSPENSPECETCQKNILKY